MFGKKTKTMDVGDVVWVLVEALVGTNNRLMAQNEDMHRRLMVRFPDEFGQYMGTQLQAEAREPRRPEPTPEREWDSPDGATGSLEDLVLSGSRRVVPDIVNQELDERQGR